VGIFVRGAGTFRALSGSFTEETMRKTSVSLLTAVLLPLALGPHPASAALIKTFTVNSTADAVDETPGDGVCETHLGNHTCTVRAAVMEANHTASGLTKIVFPAGGETVYSLSIPIAGTNDETTGDVNITRSTTIVGAGPNTTILNGAGVDRIFFVESPAVVTISNVVIQNGSSVSTGGAIRNTGTLTLADSAIAQNLAPSGGGITSSGPALTVTGSLLLLNHTSSGAVGGGGILVASGTAKIVNTTLFDNQSFGNGGGIACTNDAVCSLFNVTVHGNFADFDADASGFGGGVSTTSTGAFTLSNSIVAGNLKKLVSGFTADDCNGSFVSNGANIVPEVIAGHCQISGGFSTLPANLASSLGANGGPTFTLALQTGSAAIDAGAGGCLDQNGAPLTVDQRGAHRPAGAVCDLGAYEYNANGDVNGDGVRDVTDIFALINTLFAGGPAPNGLADVNGDGATDVSDVFGLINFLFAGGPAPV
jgi:CSLREA domain-containing protein